MDGSQARAPASAGLTWWAFDASLEAMRGVLGESTAEGAVKLSV